MTIATDAAGPTGASATRKVDRLLAHYAESHTQPVNELIHFAAIPLIVFSLLGSLLLPLSVAIFVVSRAFQFIGHKIEGKKPSFFEDLQYLLVGPLFVLSKLFLKLGVRW